jgi:type IV fimbrial biogenesis protein FimT
LVEVLLVMLVILLIQGLALPEFKRLISATRVNAASNSLFSALMLARSEAINRHSRAVICKSADGLVCTKSSTWGQGWIIFNDADNNGEVDAGETVLESQPKLADVIRVSGNGPISSYVSYTPLGATAYVSGAFQAGTFTICDLSGSTEQVRQIVISGSGRPRTLSTTSAKCL